MAGCMGMGQRYRMGMGLVLGWSCLYACARIESWQWHGQLRVLATAIAALDSEVQVFEVVSVYVSVSVVKVLCINVQLQWQSSSVRCSRVKRFPTCQQVFVAVIALNCSPTGMLESQWPSHCKPRVGSPKPIYRWGFIGGFSFVIIIFVHGQL